MYDYMLSNPQKFGAKDSPSMYGTKRAFETVDFDEINQFLDRHKGKVSDEMVKSLRIKMAQADAYYKRELAQKGSMASAIVSGVSDIPNFFTKFWVNQGLNIYDAFGGEGAKEAKDGIISAIESTQSQISGTTPESMAERDLLQTVLNTMISSGGTMVLGMGNPYATFGGFLMQSSSATERLLKDEDIPEYQKGLISVLMGTVEGALETYGAQNLISPASSGLFKKLIINSIKDLPADASQETIERAIKNSVKTKLLSGGLKVAEGMIYEGATEGTQGIADDLNKRLFNTIYEKEIFQVPDWTTDEGRREWAEQIVEQVKIGALSGGGFAGAIHGTKSLAKGFQNKGDNNRFNEEYEVVMNNSTFEKRRAEFKIAKAKNEITEEELQVLDYQLNESREIMQSIPETLSTNRKRQAYNLLTEKRAIERVMQNKSPELVASLKDRVKDIDAQLKIVGNEEVAETPDVVEEFVKDKPSRMEKVTRYQEIENIMKPKEAEVVAEEEIIEEAPVTEETTVTEEVTEEAPVTEEERTAMQEALETQPITKITTDLVAKEKKGELTQEETDGVLLGIMEKIEAENAKRKSPLSPEQAQKKLGKMQQRVFEGNKQRYLELSGVMPAAQEQVVEEAPVVEQVTEEVVEEAPVKEAPKRKTRRKKPVVKETPVKEEPKKVVVAPEVSKIESEISQIESEIEDNLMRLEDAELEVDNEKYNYKEEVKRIKEEKAKVRANKKLSKDAKRERLEDLEAEREEFMEERDANIENYKDDATELRKELRKAKNKIAKLQNKAKETPPKKAPKKSTKKKAPVKEEAKISEEVQKEIKRAEGTRDSIVGPLKTKLDRTRGFEQKEEIRDEIRQANKKYNNIITELKEGKRTRFRLSDDATVETEEGFITEDAIVEVMKGLGSAEANFKIPVGEKQTQVDPIALSKSLKKITDAQAKKLGFKSVDDMLKNIEEFNGIPMVVAMSDVLAAGTVKDSMGNDMQVDGGLLYNVLGRNKTLAWAGVNETGATVQFKEAKAMYRANKELFDRLWKEGKLPKNHVPMVVVRMDNKAINSNEAMFRFMAPKLKSFPKAVQKKAFDALMKQIESKKEKSKSEEPALIEAFIKKNKIKDIGTLFDLVVEDAKKRAKGDENTFILPTKTFLLEMIASPSGVKKPSKPVAKAIMEATDYNGEIFLIDNILSEIGEPSMVEGERGDAVAIMGVDVSKNGGVTKAKHNNYGFGPKGRLIALIKNPTNVLNVFPEWRTKAFKMFELKPSTGKFKSDAQVLADVYGQVFGDKAFRGSRLAEEISDIDMLSAQMRFAFPTVSVSQTQQEFDEVLKQEGIRKAEANGNTILGLTKDGKIFLNPSKESLSTPIHEFGHIWIDYLRSESSEAKGTKLLEKGLELVEGTKALESAIKKYGDNALAREEALVELMGTKGETIANAAKKAKFVEWFNAFFKYIKEKLTRFKDVKTKDIKDISLEDFVDIGLAELFSGEAVDASSKVKFKPEQAAESAKARMQIIGENAELSQQVREDLAFAKTEQEAIDLAEKEGGVEGFKISPDAIKEVTGWERGKDGKWRYEIQDGRLEKVENGTYKLGDIYDAPEFYKAYPDAKNIQVSIDVRKNGRENSWFFPETNSIEINVKNDYRVIQDLVHELQHYIQFKEGFAIGGNEQTFLENPEIVDDLMKNKNQLLIDNEILRAMSFVIEQVDMSDVGLDSLFTKDFLELEDLVDEQHKENLVSLGLISEDTDFNQMIEDYYFGEAYSGPGEIIGDKVKIRPKTFKGGLTEMQRRKMKIAKRDGGFDEALEELYEINEPIREDLSKLGNHALYERLAGEVEARNATTRLLLSAEKRRKKTLESTEDVAREDQILFMGDQAAAMASMAEKSNVKPSMSAQNIIKKARAAEIRDAVIVDYLMSEKKLTRKQAVSEIKRANRGDLKDAVKRLFNNVEDITDIKEKDAQLIKDILKFDRSITRADKMAQKKAKDEIKSRLKAIQRKSKGKLSQSQLLAVTNRFANVNLSSEKSIDSFVDYMQKVFSDVDYAAKMTSLNKSIKQAKKNINSRIGRGADGLAYELRRLLNISPTIIPDSVLEEYSDLVTSFGERKTVLNLKDSVEVKETIVNIFTELENQNSKLGELTERFEAFEKEERDGKVDYAKTVKKMLKDKVITEEESKLMKKFRTEIIPIETAEGKTEEQKQEEIEEEKKILLESVKSAKVDIERIELAIEKALVKDFARLIKTDAINDLNNAQLKNIEKAIDNINNGYVTHYVQLASENLVSINRSKTGAEGIRDAKPLAVSTQIAKIKTLYQKGSDANKFYKLIERNPLINIDMVLGDFTSKRIFNSVLEESAEAVTTFNTELNKVYNTIEDAEALLQKKFKNNGNEILESKYKQMAYMVQQEFESNPNNSQVNPAAEVIEATITKLRDSNQSYEADILQGILENYSTDGQIDLKKLDDSFVYAELNMIKTVQDINSKLTDKATYTASVIRGESIEPLNDYIHQSVLNTDGVAVDDSRALSENYMENIKPSTKAKNLIERTKGAKAINFDITASVRRGAKMTLMDYHLTAPLRTANRTLNKIEKQLDAAGQERQIFLAVRDAYNQAIADILENTFTSSSIGEQVFQYAAKQGYRSMLASVPRVFVELASNYAFALNNPTEFAEGSKPKNMKVAFSDRGVEVMNNVNSKQTARMYGEELSGRFVESSMINKKMGMAADSAKNPVVNRLNQGLSYLKKYPRGVEVVADFMITTPDKLVTRPMWFGSFATEFKKITGQEVDFNKIAENDAEYMDKFEEAINEAKRKADDNTVLIGATDNPLMGILKNKKRASDKGVSSLLKTINTFMQRFLLFEYNAFRKGMYAAMGRGDISRGRGARLMLAVSARMTIYTTLMPILASLIFGDDDEDEDESIYTRVYRGIVSTMTNLFIGRDFGAIVKMIQNGFIEWANKEYGRDLGLREGRYDPFKNQVQFNIIPPEKSYKETDIASDILPNMLGPYTPLVKSLIFSGNKLFFSKPKKEEEARERQRREKKERIPLELLGLTGLVPFYKDIRKKLNEDIYKGLREKDSDEGEEEESSGRRKRRQRKTSSRRKRRQR